MAMSEFHREILRKNAVYLVEYLNIDPLFLAYMRSDNILTKEMCEEILIPLNTSQRKASNFLRIINSRGANAFDTFIGALCTSEQCEISKKINGGCHKSCENSSNTCNLNNNAYNQLVLCINDSGPVFVEVPRSQYKVPKVSVNYFNVKLETSVSNKNTNEVISILSSVCSMDDRKDWSNMSKEQIELVYLKVKHELDAIKSVLHCLNNNGFKMMLTIQKDNKIISTIKYLIERFEKNGYNLGIIKMEDNIFTISIDTFNIKSMSSNDIDRLCLMIWSAITIRFIICKKTVNPYSYIYNSILTVEELNGFINDCHMEIIMESFSFNTDIVENESNLPIKKTNKPWECENLN